MTTITIVEAAILAHLSHCPNQFEWESERMKLLRSRLGADAKWLAENLHEQFFRKTQ